MGAPRILVYPQYIIDCKIRRFCTEVERIQTPKPATFNGGTMTLSFQFGTVGSPLATPKKPGGSVGAIEFSKSIGLNTFELGWVQSVRVTEVTCAAIKAKAEEQQVSLSVHAPYFINLNGLDEEWRVDTQGDLLFL